MERSYSVKAILAALGKSVLYLLFFSLTQVFVGAAYGIAAAFGEVVNGGGDMA